MGSTRRTLLFSVEVDLGSSMPFRFRVVTSDNMLLMDTVLVLYKQCWVSVEAHGRLRRLDGDSLGNDEASRAGQETSMERNNARVNSSRRYTSTCHSYGVRSGVPPSHLQSDLS